MVTTLWDLERQISIVLPPIRLSGLKGELLHLLFQEIRDNVIQSEQLLVGGENIKELLVTL